METSVTCETQTPVAGTLSVRPRLRMHPSYMRKVVTPKHQSNGWSKLKRIFSRKNDTVIVATIQDEERPGPSSAEGDNTGGSATSSGGGTWLNASPSGQVQFNTKAMGGAEQNDNRNLVRPEDRSIDAPSEQNQPTSPPQAANLSNQAVVDRGTPGRRDAAEENPGGGEEDRIEEVGEPGNDSSSEEEEDVQPANNRDITDTPGNRVVVPQQRSAEAEERSSGDESWYSVGSSSEEETTPEEGARKGKAGKKPLRANPGNIKGKRLIREEKLANQRAEPAEMEASGDGLAGFNPTILVGLPKISAFSDDPDQNWEEWLKCFHRSCKAFGMTESRMAAVLHMYLENKALMEWNQLERNGEQMGNWKVVTDALTRKFGKRRGNFRNLLMALDEYPQMKSGQSISSFYGGLASIIDKTHPGLPTQERDYLLKSALLKGFTNDSLLNEIAKRGATTLEKILDVARKWETLHNHKRVDHLEERVQKVDGVEGEDDFRRAVRALAHLNVEQMKAAKTTHLEADNQHLVRPTAEQGGSRVQCFNCGQMGHIARGCRALGSEMYPDRGGRWTGYNQRRNDTGGYRPRMNNGNYQGQRQFQRGQRPWRGGQPHFYGNPGRFGQPLQGGQPQFYENPGRFGQPLQEDQQAELVRKVTQLCERMEASRAEAKSSQEMMRDDSEEDWFFTDGGSGATGAQARVNKVVVQQDHGPTSSTPKEVADKTLRIGQVFLFGMVSLGKALTCNKAGGFIVVSLILLSLMSMSVNGSPALGDFTPPHPVLCDSILDQVNKGHLWKWPARHQCKPVTVKDGNPQDMEVQLYKRNFVEWKSPAYHCQKFRSQASTILSFFTDSKSINKSRTSLPVSAQECLTMARTKLCSSGNLAGHSGVYATSNKLTYSYHWCCKYHHFETTNCLLTETNVYKKFKSGVQSPVGDISLCNYNDGMCTLSDGSVLVWSPSKNASCEYIPWVKLNGQYHDDYFISDDNNLALSFKSKSLTSVTTCSGTTAYQSDQGLVVEFKTDISNTTLEASIESQHSLPNNTVQLLGQKGAVISGAINSMIQAAYLDLTKLIMQSFRKSISYSCNALVEYLEIIKGLIQAHPTVTLRYILETPNIYARAGNGVLEVFSCSQLSPGSYTLLPMNDSYCTEYIPIQFNYAGQTLFAYLDYVDNIIKPTSVEVSCITVRDLPVNLDGTISLYNASTGSLRPAENIETLNFVHLNLNESSLHIPEIIYRSATLIDWDDMKEHHSLNDVLAAAAKQRRVLEAMGITWEGNPETTAIENVEHIFERGFLGFITGGHVGSPWEIYVFIVIMWVTLVTFVYCIKCLCVVKRKGFYGAVNSVKASTKRASRTRKNQHKKSRVTMVSAEHFSVEELDRIERDAAPPVYPQLYPNLKNLAVVNTTGGILYVPLSIEGFEVPALWDSGSSISLISRSLAEDLALKISKTKLRATGVTGDKLSLSGESEASVILGPTQLKHKFIIFEANKSDEVILGTDLMEKVGPYLVDIDLGLLKLKDKLSGRIHHIQLTGPALH